MIDSETLPTITAERVRLRGLAEKDVPALYRVFSHPEVMRYWSSPAMTDPAEARALLEEIRRYHRERKLFQWGIALVEDDGVIGTCTLVNADPRNRRAEIGYALDRACWGRGLMNEALTALLSYAFVDLGLHRIEADVDPRNVSSTRLLETLGFEREGYLRERWVASGETQDSVLLGLIGREWLERNADGDGTG